MIRITEFKNGESCQVPYRVGGVPGIVPDQQAAIQLLRQEFGANIELNDRGEAVRLVVCGVAADGTKRAFDDTIAGQTARLTTLEQLVLTDFDSGMIPERLAFLRTLQHLTQVDIRKTNIPDSALAHLSALPVLKILKLEFNDKLTDAAATHLQMLTHLIELDLAFVNITDAGLKPLSRLTGLRRLYLYGTNVTDRGVAHLAGLKDLRTLYLGSEEGQAVTDSSVPVLAELTSLKLLGIYGTRISHSEAARLKEALPECNILAPQRAEPAAQSTEPGSDVVADGTVSGTLTLDGYEFPLRHVMAYRLKIDGQLVTSVLMTTERAPAGQLVQCVKESGNDYRFAPFIPQVRLRYSETGQLIAFHLYADNFTVNDDGHNCQWQSVIDGRQVTGFVRTNGEQEFDGKPYHFETSFDAEIL